MITRRDAIALGATALVMPYFYSVRTAKADILNDGLIANITRVSDNLSLKPSGRQADVVGGGTDFGRAVRAQADMMADAGRFTEVLQNTDYTSNVCSNEIGYTFARFQNNEHNFCCPIGKTSSLDINVGYSGAMTLLEGPNFVGLRVMTDLLNEKGYSVDEIMGFVWPLSPSSNEVKIRERAKITYQSIHSETIGGKVVFADRDVLHAKNAKCVMRYTEQNGVPDGGGQAALIVNRKEEFRVEFRYNKEILAET
jgi:hypothetical protein